MLLRAKMEFQRNKYTGWLLRIEEKFGVGNSELLAAMLACQS